MGKTRNSVQRNARRDARLPYFEAREAINIEKKEFEQVDKIMGAEFR